MHDEPSLHILAEYEIRLAEPDDAGAGPALALLALDNAHIDLPGYMEGCVVPMVPAPDVRHSAAGFIPHPGRNLLTGEPVVVPFAGQGVPYRVAAGWELAQDSDLRRLIGAPPTNEWDADSPLGSAVQTLAGREYPGCSMRVRQGWISGRIALVAMLSAPSTLPRFGCPPSAHERMAARRA